MVDCEDEDKNYLDVLIDKAYEAMNEGAAPLTTKQRNKMKSGTFCGPGRSFPVNDCKHVGVAKAYLGRAKFSKSTKEKIAACINKKAKSLGCASGKKAKAKEEVFPKFIELSYEDKKLYSSDIFESTKQLVDSSLKNPEMELFNETED